MPTVNIREAQRNLSRLIKKACEGEEVIITRDSKPVARLIPMVEPREKRQPGAMKGKLEIGPKFFEPLSEDELAAWEGADPDLPDKKE